MSQHCHFILFAAKSGDVSIGTVTTPNSKLHVRGDAYFIGDSGTKGFNFSSYWGCPVLLPELNHSMYIGLYNNEMLSIRSQYLFVNGVYISSDQSLKENISSIPNALTRISKIQGYNYDLKA